MRSGARVRGPLVALALGAALAAAPGRAAAQDDGDAPSLSGLRVAAQLGTGALATPVGFVGGGVATEWLARRLGADEERASTLAYAGAYTGAALLTAAGPALVGARGPGRGSYAAAVGGAVVGGALSALLVHLQDHDPDEPHPPCRLRCTLAAVAVFTLPSIGATVGYDVSR
ncbi:MAG TPA: hypothetical protein VFS08_08635 [Gemmatimonadaceae bacterium]|nr:hypothetical protein [Gemmatimonadaceae bacterium]